MKRGWYNRKQTSEVVFCEGDGFVFGVKHVFVRTQDRRIVAVLSPVFKEFYEPVKASGFPSLKPKEFKPRYAVYDYWSEGEAFVMEFEPGRFKVVMKDGREILPDEGTCKYFAEFFREGWWKLIPEAEALARLDKPKPPVPAAEQFGPGPWYGSGLTYRQASFMEGYGFYSFNNKTKEHVGWVSYEVVRHLWDLGMVSKERPRSTESIAGQASAVLDVPKKALKPKKKVLVEWAVAFGSLGTYRFELWPESAQEPYPGTNSFKTGRTVEVPE